MDIKDILNGIGSILGSFKAFLPQTPAKSHDEDTGAKDASQSTSIQINNNQNTSIQINIQLVINGANFIFNSGTMTISGNTETSGIDIASNIRLDFIDKNTAEQLSVGVQNKVLSRNEKNGFCLLIHRASSHPEFMALGFYASCSFGNKKDLLIWVGFQFSEPSGSGAQPKFGIELLGREKWLGAGIWKKGDHKHYGYESDATDAAYYKYFDEITLNTESQKVYDCICEELKAIGERLS